MPFRGRFHEFRFIVNDRGWFYLAAAQAVGPFSLDEMRLRRGAGTLPDETLVWSRETNGWLPARQAVSLAPPDAPPSQGGAVAASWIDGGVCPWRRLCARGVDTLLHNWIAASLFVILFFSIGVSPLNLFKGDADPIDVLTGPILTTLIVTPLNAAVMGFTGTSLGKWLFGIVVLGDDGRPIGFQSGLRREAAVWVRGLGAGLPVVSLVAVALCFRSLRQNGATPWDRRMALRVVHRPAGRIQYVTAALGTILLLALAVSYGAVLSKGLVAA